MKIYLIRHAKIKTPKDIVQGETDEIVLDEETLDLASNLQLLIKSVDKIYCSNMVRAKQTVELLCESNEKVVTDDLIFEYKKPSRFIGGPRKDLVNFWEIENPDKKYDSKWVPEDGESYEMCARRATDFLNKLKEDKENNLNSIAVIGHGMFFRYLAATICGVNLLDNPRIVLDMLRKFDWKNLEMKEFNLL